MSLSASPGSGKAGDPVTIRVDIGFDNGLVSADFGVRYDPSALSFTGAVPGSLNASWPSFLSFDNNPPGVVNVSTFDMFGAMGSASGSIALLDFAILANALGGPASFDIEGTYPGGSIALGDESLGTYSAVDTNGTSVRIIPSAAVPVAPVWALMAPGLVWMLRWRRRRL